MCLFVYAPSKAIQLEYVSETGILSSDASLDVVIDLLITNKSSESIESLDIIVPQSVDIADVKDVSGTLLDPNSPYNSWYDSSFSSFQYNDLGDSTEIMLNMPSPTQSQLDIEYTGIISGNTTLRSHAAIDNEDKATILQALEITALTCELGIPMPPEKARWFRWKLRAPHASINTRSKAIRLVDTLRNRLTYYFEIAGPLRVRNYFFILMANYGRTTREQAALKSTSPEDRESLYDIYGSGQELMNAMWNKGMDPNIGTSVEIVDWRIHLYPNVMRNLNNIQREGDVAIAGTYPNMIWRPSVSGGRNYMDVCYEWKSGSTNLGGRQGVGDFSITYATKYEPILFQFLPFISFLLALVGLIIGIWALISPLS